MIAHWRPDARVPRGLSGHVQLHQDKIGTVAVPSDFFLRRIRNHPQYRPEAPGWIVANMMCYPWDSRKNIEEDIQADNESVTD